MHRIMKFLVTIIVYVNLPTTLSRKEEIKIGGLFSANEKLEELVLKHAVEYVNEKNAEDDAGYNLVALTEIVPEDDSFYVTRVVCNLLSEGVVSIFGSSIGDATIQVKSICDTKGIPYLRGIWDSTQQRDDFMVNLYPNVDSYSSVIADIVQKYNWTNMTIIYENNESLLRLEKLLQMTKSHGLKFFLKQLDAEGNHRQTFREVRDFGEKHILLDCSINVLEDVLRQAQQTGIMTNEYSYIITSLDFHTIDLELFRHAGTNITGIRMQYNAGTADIAASWPTLEGETGVDVTLIKTSEAFLFDAVLLLAEKLQKMDVDNLEAPQLNCNSPDAWYDGPTLLNFLRDGDTTFEGFIGPLQLDYQGFNSEYMVEVFQLVHSGIEVIGTWSFSQKLHIKRTEAPPNTDEKEDTLWNKNVIVITAISAPYGMIKKSGETYTGNDKYEGFGIDIIQDLAKKLNFTYTFHIQENSKYGGCDNKTGKCSEMLGEVVEKRADLAITDLTITSDRECCVDFTTPFLHLGISILYKKAKKEPPGTFSFMEPFSLKVWLCVFSAYLGVSFLFFVMGRICPYEWNNPYPCVDEPEELENQFNLDNSLWFTIGSLIQQGSEVAPIGSSTRMVAGIWWFFALIMVSSYTANLAAFLTVEKPNALFADAESLANHPFMSYGAKNGGATEKYFKDSPQEIHKKMYAYMQKNKADVLPGTNDEGVQKVKTEPHYAFLMESSSIEYITERNCDLDKYGGLLDSKGYGIAMRKNASYLKDLTTAVLKLKEDGRIAELYSKWWKEKGGGKCEAAASTGAPESLGLQNVLGVFIVLGVGIVLTFIFSFLELVISTWRVASREKVPFREELMHELRFVARMRGSIKPVRQYNEDSIEEEEEEKNERENSLDNLNVNSYAEKVPFS